MASRGICETLAETKIEVGMKKTLSLFYILLWSIVFAQDCYESSIVSPVPFMGNNGEIFKLIDGTIWEVTYEYEYLYEYYPSVIICPNKGKLILKDKSLNVKLISKNNDSEQTDSEWEVFEETNLKGNISGTIKKGYILKTTSGNIYEVTGLTLQLVLELQPNVLILRKNDTYKLIVDGFDEPLICKCLKKTSDQTIGFEKNKKRSQQSSVIESQIEGDFNGFDGETIVKLINGQIWQQAEYYYYYHYSYMPKVLIYKSGSIFKMKVNGIDKAIGVIKLN